VVTVEQAQQIIQERLIYLGTEKVPVSEATGRILVEEIAADRDFPPYDRVAMDGIAIDFKAFEEGRRKFQISATGAAGQPQIVLSDQKSCVEIMTGAILPVGTDAVIRYEDTEIENGVAKVMIEDVQQWQNIHRKGIDRKQDDVIIRPPKILTAAEIGVAATVGKYEINVVERPSVCIISTGDEVVPIHRSPLPHQIRTSNTHTVQSILQRIGIESYITHLPDDEEFITTKLKEILDNFSVIILSGGVSKGKFDYIPDCLDKLGVQKHFHRIAQRPGKPFWFGSRENRNYVFALPGNPVSTTACTVRYLVPWIKASMGLHEVPQYVLLSEDVNFKPDLTLFQQCMMTSERDGKCTAKPVFGHGSGDLASLADANGFVELPKGRNTYHAGEAYRWYSWF
jgi:molybdopterin molybdotransferase